LLTFVKHPAIIPIYQHFLKKEGFCPNNERNDVKIVAPSSSACKGLNLLVYYPKGYCYNSSEYTEWLKDPKNHLKIKYNESLDGYMVHNEW
jgi:hypothetical protein